MRVGFRLTLAPPGTSIAGSYPQQPSPQHTRRRSTVLMNLQLNNPSVPAPGEMVHEPHAQTGGGSSPRLGAASGAGVGDPHHLRYPSLGEIHQELEQEQEAQVVSTPSQRGRTETGRIKSPLG